MTAHPTPSGRLPRYKRAAGDRRFALTERDCAIIALVERYRLVTSEHILALSSGSDQGLLRRLQRLFHEGYLDRIAPRRSPGGGSAPMVYAVTNRAVRWLIERGALQEPSRTDWNAKNRSLHDLSIRHTLLVSQIRAVMELAAASRPDLRLCFWREGHGLYDSIEVALSEGYRRVPVAPDAYFALEDAKGKMYFFLEADRGTMTLKRFTSKLKAYAAYFQERRHQEKFGIRFFRVLTVTTGSERKKNLVSAAGAEDEVRALGRMFLFSAEEALSLRIPERALGSIWTTAAGEDASLILGSSAGPNPTEVIMPQSKSSGEGNRRRA